MYEAELYGHIDSQFGKTHICCAKNKYVVLALGRDRY